MRAAVIDIGSNSTKLIIGEREGEDIKILESLKNIIPIGKSTFYQGRISQEIFTQTIQVLEQYKKLINEYAVTSVKVIATTAVREADNRDIFTDTVSRKTGFPIEVLNVGDVVYYIDAFLSYKLKKSYPINEKNLLIAELGAGSLDISVMEKGYTLMNLGVPIGTSRLRQFKGKIEGSQRDIYEAVSEYVDNEFMNFKRLLPHIKLDDILLIDESYSTVLHRILPNKKRESNFFQFQFRESKQLLNRIIDRNLDVFAQKYDLTPEVADSMDGYAIIINKLFQLIKKRSIYILETSLSEALLANMILDFDIAKKYSKENQLISVAKFLCRKFDADLKHTRHVAFLAEELFKQFKDMLGLKDADLLYLTLAAYLHSIGIFVNNRAHHKHTEYMINTLTLFRLTSQEIKCIACIARYHRKAAPQRTHFLYSGLSPEEQLLVQKLSSLLRLANAMDSAHKQKIKKIEVIFGDAKNIKIVGFSQENIVLEKFVFSERKQLFEEISGNAVSLVVKRPI